VLAQSSDRVAGEHDDEEAISFTLDLARLDLLDLVVSSRSQNVKV
jgi:hypothetical protein